MRVSAEEKSGDGGKAEEGKNRLGISRAVYAVGYSMKDWAIWTAIATLTVFSIITLGVKKEVPAIKTFADKLAQWHKAWKGLTGKWFDGTVIAMSLAVGWIVGHLAQIPSSALGWRKAQAAIEKHNALHAEKDQLVTVNSELKEANERLKAALAQREESRPSNTERVRQSAAAGSPGIQ